MSESQNKKSHSNWRWPPVNQHTIGEMELVPSAVGPNPIEQRCRIAKVRTLQKVWSPEARNPFLVLWGLVIPKRTRPEGPLRSRPEGQKNNGSARSKIRKRQRASKKNIEKARITGKRYAPPFYSIGSTSIFILVYCKSAPRSSTKYSSSSRPPWRYVIPSVEHRRPTTASSKTAYGV